jgi:hypothetical protein
MRELDYDCEFDVVINWFTSFGYFGSDINDKLLGTFRAALRPGGRLLIDHRSFGQPYYSLARSGSHGPLGCVRRSGPQASLLDRVHCGLGSVQRGGGECGSDSR